MGYSGKGKTMPVDDEVGQDQITAPDPTPTFDEWQSAQNTETANSQQEASVEAPSAQQEAPSQPQTPPGAGHPAWDPIRAVVGDEVFDKIKPHLSEFDKNAQSRITELNSKYDPWGQFEKQGVNPDIVTRALGIVRGIDENPLQMYQLLESHLRSQGLLQEPGQVDPNQVDPDAEVDPRDLELQALREQQEQMAQFLQAQQMQAQQEQMNRQADSALDQEIQTLRQAHEGISKQEEGVILQEYARRLKAGEYDASLEAIYAEREAYRNQILSQPRPNDFAPRIPGSGGTAPTAANHQQKEVADYSREESTALLAEMIGRAVQQGN
jgi:hypothetical protein